MARKKQEKKEEKKNPYQHEYGMLSNTAYILGRVRRYCPTLLALMILSLLTIPVVQCLFSFIGKFVIDIVQMQADSADKDFYPLVRVVLIAFAVELTAMLLEAVADNKRWYYMIYTRMQIITERAKKALYMNYEMLEKPDILDMEEKAQEATGGNVNGVEGMMHASVNVGVNLVLLLLTLSTVAVLDWRMLLVLTVIGTLQHLFFRHTVKKDRREVWDKLAPTWRKIHYMQQTTQNFDYAKDIRLFSMKNWLLAKQHGVLMEKQNRMIHSRNLWIRNAAVTNGLIMLSTAVVYAVLIRAVISNGLSIGNFTLYLGLSMTFSSAMTDLLNHLGTLKECSLEVDNFRSFMDLAADGDERSKGSTKVKNSETAKDSEKVKNNEIAKDSEKVKDNETAKDSEKIKDSEKVKGREEESNGDAAYLPIPDADHCIFTFRDVCFRYEGAEKDALHHLNLTFSPGERLAVVGLNGAGKTTFIKLLLRLYDVTSGEILLNGMNIKRFERTSYYRLFAPVFQNVELFAFPMAENVSMLPPERTDKEKSRDCLIRAGLGEKLESLTDGVDTELLKILSDDGIDLSGGERQKLALARALYKDAPVMVLDEPTAALDALAEYRLYRNFDNIIGNKSAIYISHRLSSTRFCHHVAMFQEGEMVEYGSHEELLARNGAYAEMFHIQAQYYQETGKEAAANG